MLDFINTFLFYTDRNRKWNEWKIEKEKDEKKCDALVSSIY
jgi:hypothetical protein